jgi:hypothetical protein
MTVDNVVPLVSILVPAFNSAEWVTVRRQPVVVRPVAGRLRLHIEHLRGLEESERVRSACLDLLLRNSIDFDPERHELVAELQRPAADLGRHLDVPRLPQKYDWIRQAFGWRVTKRVRMLVPGIRGSVARRWDQALAALKGVARSGAAGHV